MKKISLPFFSIIFYTGALFGFLLTGMATWADLEAASYGFDHTGGERLGTLYCPILMTATETSTFFVKVTNTTDKKIIPSIKTDVTTRLEPVSSYTSFELAPGETKRVEWPIGPENLKLGQFIFARAWVNAYYPLPSRENVCGVFIVNLPASGQVITWTMVGLSLLGIGIGLYGVTKLQGSAQNRRVDMVLLNVMAALTIAGIITSFMGWWMPGVAVTIVFLLLIIVSTFAVRH